MAIEGKRIISFPTGTGKMFILPLRPEPKPLTDAQKTTYPALPFLREHELEKEVIKMLAEIPDYYNQPSFSLIPAIKHAKDVMRDWDLRTAKEYVEKIYKNNARQIDAARVHSMKSWRKADERIQKLQKSVADARDDKS